MDEKKINHTSPGAPEDAAVPTGQETPASAPLTPETESQDTTTQTAAPTQTDTGAAQTSKKGLILVIILALAAAGILYLALGTDVLDRIGMGNGENQTASTGDTPEAVATINGEPVPYESYEQGVEQASNAAAQQGLDPSDPSVQGEIESQALTVAVNTALLIQSAEAAGMTTSDAEVTEQIAELETQYGGSEAFAAQLEAAGLSQEELRVDVSEQLLLDKYIQASPEWENVSVSEEEKQAFYDSISGQGGDEVPAYAEVEAQIEQQLLSQKQRAATAELIDRLRSEADIEILI